MPIVAAAPRNSAALVREARVGQVLPARVLGSRGSRRLEAVAVIVPGAGDLGDYLASLDLRHADFAAWDGLVNVLAPDGQADHRLAIVDRYGQVYQVADAREASGLPSAADLEEWFRFLATACPECGVLDDPTDRDWVP